MRNRVLSYFCHGPYQVEISSRLDLVASTPRVPASTEVDFASTNSSQFVPRMEVVEAVEAIPHTDIESLLMNSEESQNLRVSRKRHGVRQGIVGNKSRLGPGNYGYRSTLARLTRLHPLFGHPRI